MLEEGGKFGAEKRLAPSYLLPVALIGVVLAEVSHPARGNDSCLLSASRCPHIGITRDQSGKQKWHQVNETKDWIYICCCSVTKSRLTLCNCMKCSMPGFPVLHHLSEFAQSPVHWIGDAIQSRKLKKQKGDTKTKKQPQEVDATQTLKERHGHYQNLKA